MCFESFSNTELNIKPNSDYHVKKNHFIDSIPVPFQVYAVLATIRFLCWPPPGRRRLPLLRLPRELLHRRSARRLAGDSRVGRARPAALVVVVLSPHGASWSVCSGVVGGFCSLPHFGLAAVAEYSR